MSVHAAETRTVRGACPQDCPDTCAFIYHVEDGKLVEVTGDPAHPMTRGGLCVKLKDFAEHHYNPDRILYPMKRVGPKGSGKYERIGWDEARMTHFVRNRLIISRKWGASWVGLTPRMLGYLVKALLNGRVTATLRGIRDAFHAEIPHRRRMPKTMRDYLHINETRHRGSWLNRLRTEVFGRVNTAP